MTIGFKCFCPTINLLIAPLWSQPYSENEKRWQQYKKVKDFELRFRDFELRTAFPVANVKELDTMDCNPVPLAVAPADRIVLRNFIMGRIQQLVQQLQLGYEEETIILTASMDSQSCTLLGSNLGRMFLKKRKDIEDDFLAFCFREAWNKPSNTKGNHTCGVEDNPSMVSVVCHQEEPQVSNSEDDNLQQKVEVSSNERDSDIDEQDQKDMDSVCMSDEDSNKGPELTKLPKVEVNGSDSLDVVLQEEGSSSRPVVNNYIPKSNRIRWSFSRRVEVKQCSGIDTINSLRPPDTKEKSTQTSVSSYILSLDKKRKHADAPRTSQKIAEVQSFPTEHKKRKHSDFQRTSQGISEEQSFSTDNHKRKHSDSQRTSQGISEEQSFSTDNHKRKHSDSQRTNQGISEEQSFSIDNHKNKQKKHDDKMLLIPKVFLHKLQIPKYLHNKTFHIKKYSPKKLPVYSEQSQVDLSRVEKNDHENTNEGTCFSVLDNKVRSSDQGLNIHVHTPCSEQGKTVVFSLSELVETVQKQCQRIRRQDITEEGERKNHDNVDGSKQDSSVSQYEPGRNSGEELNTSFTLGTKFHKNGKREVAKKGPPVFTDSSKAKQTQVTQCSDAVDNTGVVGKTPRDDFEAFKQLQQSNEQNHFKSPSFEALKQLQQNIEQNYFKNLGIEAFKKLQQTIEKKYLKNPGIEALQQLQQNSDQNHFKNPGNSVPVMANIKQEPVDIIPNTALSQCSDVNVLQESYVHETSDNVWTKLCSTQVNAKPNAQPHLQESTRVKLPDPQVLDRLAGHSRKEKKKESSKHIQQNCEQNHFQNPENSKPLMPNFKQEPVDIDLNTELPQKSEVIKGPYVHKTSDDKWQKPISDDINIKPNPQPHLKDAGCQVFNKLAEHKQTQSSVRPDCEVFGELAALSKSTQKTESSDPDMDLFEYLGGEEQ